LRRHCGGALYTLTSESASQRPPIHDVSHELRTRHTRCFASGIPFRRTGSPRVAGV